MTALRLQQGIAISEFGGNFYRSLVATGSFESQRLTEDD